MDFNELYAKCQAFEKQAAGYSVVKNFDAAVSYYEKSRGVTLTPGPAGTQGQIFFIKEKPNRVLKLTMDASEAANMYELMRAQEKERNKKRKLFDGVVNIYDVFKINPPGSLPTYAIEQELGQDLTKNKDLYRYIKRILFLTGPSIQKTRGPELDSILDDLETNQSEKLQMIGRTSRNVRKKIDPSFRDIVPSNMVYVPSDDDIVDDGPESEGLHPSMDDYLNRSDSRLKGKIKMTDVGYGTLRDTTHIPIK